MVDSDRILCKKHRKKDRSEKFLSFTEILIFREGGPEKNKNSKIFMMDSVRILCKKHRKKDRSEKFTMVAEILIFREGPPLRKIKNRKKFYDRFQ